MQKFYLIWQDDIDMLLTRAKIEFRKEDKEYQAIIVIYSGHGNANNLQLSKYKQEYCKHDFIHYFNGLGRYQFYFMDCCRGQGIPKISGAKGLSLEPEENRAILYGTADGYRGYEVPYNEETMDIESLDNLSKEEFDKL